ncbi:hypothetical protein BN136_3498 [Cronobacter universalis NCTC 9529]|nr:hypothetical protein BN136_3498 [Cronobacter universalis NCTC 9529]
MRAGKEKKHARRRQPVQRQGNAIVTPARYREIHFSHDKVHQSVTDGLTHQSPFLFDIFCFFIMPRKRAGIRSGFLHG